MDRESEFVEIDLNDYGELEFAVACAVWDSKKESYLKG